MTNTARLIADLESEYELETGFVGQIRTGHFDAVARARLMRLVESIDLGEAEAVDRRVVALLWYLPLVLTWNAPRFDDEGLRSAIRETSDRVTAELERIFGIP
jgi:hypothetical protein